MKRGKNEKTGGWGRGGNESVECPTWPTENGISLGKSRQRERERERMRKTETERVRESMKLVGRIRIRKRDKEKGSERLWKE